MKSQYREDHLFELFLKALIAIFIFGILLTLMKLLAVQKISSFGVIMLVLAIGLDLLFTSSRIDLSERKYEYPRPPLLIIIITGIAGILFALFFFLGVFLILKQVYFFLTSGVWIHLSGIDFLHDYKSIFWGSTTLTKWALEPEGWLGLHRIIGFLNGGTMSIVLGVIFCAVLCIPFLYWNDEYKILKSAKKPKINKNYVSLVINLDEENKVVPKDVNFDENLLLVPTLNELGVPIPLSYIPFTITYHRDLSWVEKGDPLITYYFWTYETQNKSSILSSLGGNVFLNEFHLTSPISALLIHYRQDGARLKRSFGTSQLFKRKHNSHPHNGLIEYNKVAPTLLVPRGTGTSYLSTNELHDISIELTKFIHETWRYNVHNSGQTYEYKRVKLEEVFNPEITDFNIFNCGTVGSSLNIEDQKTVTSASRWINASSEYITKRSRENKWRCVGFQEYNKKISFDGISFQHRSKERAFSEDDYYAYSFALSLEERTRNSEDGDLRSKIEHLFKYIPEKPVDNIPDN